MHHARFALISSLLLACGGATVAAGEAPRGVALLLGGTAADRVAQACSTHRLVVLVAKTHEQAAAWRRDYTQDRVQIVTWSSASMIMPRCADTVEADLSAMGISSEQCSALVAPTGTMRVREGNAWKDVPVVATAGIGAWTHTRGDAGGNAVASDTIVRFPVSLRWQDGVVWNPNWVHDTRGVVAAEGRMFALTQAVSGGVADGEWVVEARSGWNGIPLWRHGLGKWSAPDALHYTAVGPLAVVDRFVFAPSANGLAVIDAATGERRRTLSSTQTIMRLAVDGGFVAYSGWAGAAGKNAADSFLDATIGNNRSLRSQGVGSVQVASISDGTIAWSKPVAAERLWMHRGTVVMMVGRDAIAVDAASGTERWRIADADPMVVGEGVVVLRTPDQGKVVDIATGAVRFTYPKPAQAGFLLPGELWIPGSIRALTTGAEVRAMPGFGAANYCFWPVKFGSIVEASRTGNYTDVAAVVSPGAKGTDRAKGGFSWGGVRGSCYVGTVPALGSLMFTPNKCACVPAAIGAFTAVGPGEAPADEVWNAQRPVEILTPGASPGVAASSPWPGLLGGSQRRSSIATAVPRNAALRWTTPVVAATERPLSEVFAPASESSITPPVLGGDLVAVADVHRGVVVAMRADSGAVAWRQTLPSRIGAPPTWMNGLWLTGCDDGWVYALRAADGAVAWRTRIAPTDATCVSWGRLTSRWPVHGGVLDAGDVAVAVAGRSSDMDGGIAVVAFEPATGRMRWAGRLGPDFKHRVDLPIRQGDQVLIANAAFSLATGARGKAATTGWQIGVYGLLDVGATQGKTARQATRIGTTPALLGAWNDAAGVAWSPGAKAITPLPPLTWSNALTANQRVEALAVAQGIAVSAVVTPAQQSRTPTPPSQAIRLIDLASGQTISDIALPASVIRRGLALGDGRIFVCTSDGSVHCLAAP